MMFYDHDMGWWGYASMGFGMVLFWVLLIFGTIVLIRMSTRDGDRRVTPPSSAEQVLAERFAHGEISETEYRDRLLVLRDHTRHVTT